MYSAAISADLWRLWLFRLALRFLFFIEETLPDRGPARLLPEVFEPLRRQFGIAHRVLNVLVPEVVL